MSTVKKFNRFWLLLIATVIGVCHFSNSFSQTTVFIDDFNRASVSPGGTPSMTYTNTVAAGVTVSTNSSTNLRIAQTTTSGISYVTGSTSTFSSPYNTTLSSNPGIVTWTFNFRWNRASSNNPAAPASGSYGQAIILAGSSATLTSGTGYAIVYGSSSTPDPIRLVRYSAGISTLTDIISSGANDIANTNNYVSVRVTYDPSSNTWALFIRDDGASAWADPSSGVTNQIGSNTVNSTYTGSALGSFGFLWSHSNTAGNTGDFDNLKVTVVSACTPPATPTTPTAASNPACNSTTLNTLTAPAGEVWYWQGTSPTGTSTASPTSSTYPVSASGTYYVRAFTTATSCWSTSSSSIVMTVNSSPTVTSTAATFASTTSASSGGNITATGGSAVTVSGICWGTVNPPTTADNITTDGLTTTGSYTSTATGLSAGTTYYIRAYATNACGTSYGTVQTYLYNPCTEPSAQATSLVLTPVSATSINGSFTASGSANGYIIIRSTSSTLSADPVDGTTYSAGNTIGGGTVVQVGASTTFTSSGLSGGTQYYYFVYSYNSGACATNYLTSVASLTGNAYTFCNQPSGNPTSFSLTAVSTTQINGSFTAAVTGNGSIVVISTSATLSSMPADGSTYIVGDAIGGGTVIMVGSGTTFSAGSLTPGVLYYFHAFSYNASPCGYNYFSSANTLSSYTQCTEPTAQPTVLTFPSFSATQIDGSFTASGSANGYIIIRSTSSTLSANPVDGVTYSAGNSIGGGTVVSVTTGTTFSATGLTSNTLYYFFIYAYNSGSTCVINYLSSSAALTNNQVTSSALSDVITANGEPASISSTINNNAPLTSSTGIQVWQFTVRDGGGTADADALPTIINNVTFTTGASGNTVNSWVQAIKTAALFNGSTFIATASTITATQIQFTGLNFSVGDNSNATLSLRISLNCGIGSSNFDGDKFTFRISNTNITTTGSSSSFSSFTSAPSAVSGANVIDVTGTQLVFVQQPSNTSQGMVMSPYVTVKAIDPCGNTDLGFTTPITITSSSSMTGGTAGSQTSGLATFNSVVHSVPGTGYTLTASAAGVTSATSNTFNIVTPTVFNPGDFAIVAVNTQVLSSGSTDEICFVTFEDIAPGTTFDITDNGYERANAGQWGNTEGIFRFTRSASASTISKGTVICINGPYSADDGDANGMGRYDLFICGSKDDANWIGAPQGSSSAVNFDLNSNDQVWIFQGGTWSDGAGTSTGTHSGIAMYGWTATGWKPNIGSTPTTWTTAGSRMYPNMTCFTTDVAATTNNSKVKYTGSMAATTRLGWLARINTPSNWTGYATNTAYDATVGAYDYNLINPGSACSDITFNINTAVETDGLWTGAKNTDWFECANWQTLKVPDSTINVQVPDVTNDPIIGASPTPFPNGAICQDLSILTSGAILTLNNSLSYLSIKRHVYNDGTITWLGGGGKIQFRSANAQIINGSGITTIYNLSINNSNAGGVSLFKDVTVSNQLIFNNGMLSTGTNKLIITNTTVPTITGYTNTRFINGTLRQYIGSNTSTYVFPVGDGMATTNYKRADLVNNNLAGITYIDGSVNTVTETAPNDDGTFAGAGQTQNGAALGYIMENAQWDLTPDAAPTANDYGVRLYTANTGLSAGDDDQFFAVKRPSSSVTYADWVSLDVSTTVPAAGAAGRIYNSGLGYAERLGYTSFSKHAIATLLNPLPIELLTFTAKYDGISAVNLYWSTATETNNDYFTVERSTDAVAFRQIQTVDGAGNSSVIRNYSGIDREPVTGINYYRLKQTDFDGKTTYSKIIPITISAAIEQRVYPNPATDHVNVALANPAGALYFEVYDLQGVIVIKEHSQVPKDGIVTVDLGELAAGTYILKTISGTQTKQTLIIKQ